MRFLRENRVDLRKGNIQITMCRLPDPIFSLRISFASCVISLTSYQDLHKMKMKIIMNRQGFKGFQKYLYFAPCF